MIRAAVLAAVLAVAASAAQAAEPVKVMILGTFHMSNPGRDMHNARIEDVLAPRHQADLARAADGLAKFRPTQVMVEWDAKPTEERYAKYLAGTLDPSRNEVVQVGFRLARQAGLQRVEGIDVDGDFPYGPVDAYAKAHGQQGLLDEANAEIAAMVKRQEESVSTKGLTATLRWVNDPAFIAGSNGFYRTTLRIGAGSTQPGADLLTAWYRRNFLICANIVQKAKPGDRIVVLYGHGHSFLLRQCVQETPGFELVEPNAYLPR
jgi:hypothetical protein